MIDKTLVKTPSGVVEIAISPTEGIKVMQAVGELGNAAFTDCVFEGLTISGSLLCFFTRTKWKNCKFTKDANFSISILSDCVMEDCDFEDLEAFQNVSGLIIKNPKTELPDLANIKQKLNAKTVVALPNKMFVKVTKECDFCHHDITNIVSRLRPMHWMKRVPNCDRYVCENCYKMYDLVHKEGSNRTYGYRGPVSFFRTPMDKRNTAILGLEMEFEGDFHGWKELEDAHQGNAFYGYDSSVRGQNELSWDCGSYSWWKYLSRLKDVCRALRDGGAEEGPTAGIHIHISRPDVNNGELANKINTFCQTGYMRTLMEAVSLRTDKERFERYANLGLNCGNHHSGISRSNHNTVEFRVFASSLDEKLILLRLKFVKELFELVADGTPVSLIPRSFSKRIKTHIAECAEIQAEKGFISNAQKDELLAKIKEEV